MTTLRPNEKIYLIKRRHRIVLMVELFPMILIFFIIVALIVVLFFIPLPQLPDWLMRISPIFLKLNLRYLLLFFLSLFLPIFWQIIFLSVADYYLDCWIVTNERTIHTELQSLFKRIESNVPHDKIQDITIDIKGILPTFLNFGDLLIETAGEFQKFVFRQIPDPEKAKEIIFQAQKELLKTLKKDGIL